DLARTTCASRHEPSLPVAAVHGPSKWPPVPHPGGLRAGRRGPPDLDRLPVVAQSRRPTRRHGAAAWSCPRRHHPRVDRPSGSGGGPGAARARRAGLPSCGRDIRATRGRDAAPGDRRRSARLSRHRCFVVTGPEVLTVATLLVGGFTACAEFGSYAFVHPVIRRLPVEHHVAVEQGLVRTFGRFMPVAMTVSLLLISWWSAVVVTDLPVAELVAVVVWAIGLMTTILVN